MLGQHIRCRLKNDANIATSPKTRRIVAEVVLRKGRSFGLLTFGLADTHLHMETPGDDGSELARRVELSLGRRLDHEVGFERVRADEIRDQWHLYNTFNYILDQLKRHRIEGIDPWLEGTNVPDLLGLRTAGLYTVDNVRAHLPRIRREALLARLGLQHLEPAAGPAILLPDATAAASCLPDLRGNRPITVSARRAAVAAVDGTVGCGDLARTLGVHPTTVGRLRGRGADPALVRAVQLQLGMRASALGLPR